MRPEPYDMKRERQREQQDEIAGQICFWDGNPASVILNGTPFCAVHAVCWYCGTPLLPDMIPHGCICDKYGYGGHEEALWCSEEHMLNSHLDRDEGDDTTMEEEPDETHQP